MGYNWYCSVSLQSTVQWVHMRWRGVRLEKIMRCTHRTERIVVVECSEVEAHVLPVPLHTINYQSGVLRLEYSYDTPTLVALRLCGIEVPNW